MISRLGFGPLLPVIESDLGINHIQAGGFFSYFLGLLYQPFLFHFFNPPILS